VALGYLWKPFACARDLELSPWDFPLRLLQLHKLGVSDSILRRLVSNGYVDRAEEQPTFRDPARRFRPSANVAFNGETCFVLTEAGALAAGFTDEAGDRPPGRLPNPPEIVSFGSQMPHWNCKLRQLSFAGCVVKQFRLPARNQEAVLSAFEGEGWPPLIDDPLPFLPGRQRSKQRLHWTIRYLNANHAHRLLRFRGNGTGEAVLWEPIAASAIERPGATLEARRAA
jgi:hypothetical protein